VCEQPLPSILDRPHIQGRTATFAEVASRNDGAEVTVESEAKLLRIFVAEDDTWDDRPLYQQVVRLARARGLAGATVLRGIEGFGRSSRVRTARILRPSDLPLVIELVDAPDKIASFLQEIGPMIDPAMVSLESVEVRVYRRSDTARESRGE
jgi:uncharacterized protein